MKQFFQILIAIGIVHLIVSIFEFFINPKVSGSILLAPIFLGVGFIGLLIIKKFKVKNKSTG